MEEISLLGEGGIVFAFSDSAKSQAIRRTLRAKQLRKLAPRLYTNNMEDSPEAIVRRNQYPILGVIFPGAVLSHRSALEGGQRPYRACASVYRKH